MNKYPMNIIVFKYSLLKIIIPNEYYYIKILFILKQLYKTDANVSENI